VENKTPASSQLRAIYTRNRALLYEALRDQRAPASNIVAYGHIVREMEKRYSNLPHEQEPPTKTARPRLR